MTNLLPFDLAAIVDEELERESRPNDFLLHASSHLEGSLRHTQLDLAGAPKVREPLVRRMPLWIGSLIHEDIHRILRKVGVPYLAEVNMTPWLPRGWGGTADAFFWHSETKQFVLTDFKTSKGESLKYIAKDGAKIEHIKQTSAYWQAAKKMGLPLAKKIGVMYWPKNDTAKKDEVVEPLLVDFEPIPASYLAKDMKERHGAVSEYLKSLPKPNPRPLLPEEFLTDALAPGPEREQRLYFDRYTETWEVKLISPWYSAFCPYGELCTCGDIGFTTKIGTYDVTGDYYPRSGYESIKPTVKPNIS